MHWNSFSEFLAMGGYAPFVWGSFGVTAALILIESVWVRQQHRKALQKTQHPKRQSVNKASSS